MNNLYKTKQVIIILLIIAIIGVIFLSIKYNKKENTKEEVKTDIVNTEAQETRSLCYYRSDLMKSGFSDKAWMKLNITGDKVTGEFQNLPAESDSKVGEFTGTILPANSTVNEKSATVWWDSQAEGMEVKEELAIKFNNESATVGFGEMVDSLLGDGVYLYKDKTNLYWIKGMDQMDCVSLDEKLFVEKYIQDNIKTIATDKAVLGGSWYVLSVNVIPSTKSGEVTYEDGHIQSKATFIYAYNTTSQEVTISKFEVK